MKKELIKTTGYLLVVDDSEIERDDHFLYDGQFVMMKKDGFLDGKKIIAHLPLNNLPILEGVPLLPPLEVEDDVQRMADEYSKNYRCPATNDQEYCKHDIISAFNNGYNKAREKYKFTEEDMRKAIELSYSKGLAKPNTGRLANIPNVQKQIIQSLSQPKMPTYFEFEIVPKKEGTIMLIPPCKHCVKPKTITNSQGQQVACGKYIYEI